MFGEVVKRVYLDKHEDKGEEVREGKGDEGKGGTGCHEGDDVTSWGHSGDALTDQTPQRDDPRLEAT